MLGSSLMFNDGFSFSSRKWWIAHGLRAAGSVV